MQNEQTDKRHWQHYIECHKNAYSSTRLLIYMSTRILVYSST